jgi:hypothetical protein
MLVTAQFEDIPVFCEFYNGLLQKHGHFQWME